VKGPFGTAGIIPEGDRTAGAFAEEGSEIYGYSN